MKVTNRTLIIGIIGIALCLALASMLVHVKLTRYIKDAEVEYDRQVELMREASARGEKWQGPSIP
jgi:uncharacterized membrane protein